MTLIIIALLGIILTLALLLSNNSSSYEEVADWNSVPKQSLLSRLFTDTYTVDVPTVSSLFGLPTRMDRVVAWIASVGEAQHRAAVAFTRVEVAADRSIKAKLAEISAKAAARTEARREQFADALQSIALDEAPDQIRLDRELEVEVLKHSMLELFCGSRLATGLRAFRTAYATA